MAKIDTKRQGQTDQLAFGASSLASVKHVPATIGTVLQLFSHCHNLTVMVLLMQHDLYLHFIPRASTVPVA